MMLAIASLLSDKPLNIRQFDAVNVSFPGFLPKLMLLENEDKTVWKISINRRYQSSKLDNLDSRVNDALTSNNDDALFILGETYIILV